MNNDATPAILGIHAPDFSLPRTIYESVTLADLAGRPAVLVFYPGDWEPVSRQQFALYQEFLSEVQRFDAALLGISVDSVWSHAAFARALDLTFPLLADFHPKGAVCRAYGVYQKDQGCSRRALIVLDGEGNVSFSRSFPANLNPGIDPILTALERMRDTRIPSSSCTPSPGFLPRTIPTPGQGSRLPSCDPQKGTHPMTTVGDRQ